MSSDELNALWAVNFFIPPSGTAVFGSGVVVLNNGTLRGGDSTYYYTGNYEVNQGVFTAQVKIIHYSGSYNNLDGPFQETEAVLKATPNQHEFEISGQYVNSQQPVTARLERLAEL
jgi:T3SS negative regulator,GrlR